MSVISFPPSSVGKWFFFQIKVFNYVGSSLSDTASYQLASAPLAPLSGPYNDVSFTSSSMIRVTFDSFSLPSLTGGSEILSYNIQKDDG